MRFSALLDVWLLKLYDFLVRQSLQTFLLHSVLKGEYRKILRNKPYLHIGRTQNFDKSYNPNTESENS